MPGHDERTAGCCISEWSKERRAIAAGLRAYTYVDAGSQGSMFAQIVAGSLPKHHGRPSLSLPSSRVAAPPTTPTRTADRSISWYSFSAYLPGRDKLPGALFSTISTLDQPRVTGTILAVCHSNERVGKPYALLEENAIRDTGRPGLPLVQLSILDGVPSASQSVISRWVML